MNRIELRHIRRSKGLAKQMVEAGRDSWEIEVTGGPLIERPSDPNYNYTDLVDSYWPASLAAVQYYTNRISTQYVGHSNECRETCRKPSIKEQADKETSATTIKILLFILALILVVMPHTNASLETLIGSYNFNFNVPGTVLVDEQSDYMLDLNNNSIPDMLIINLTTNASLTETYTFIVNLEDQNGIISIKKNETVMANTLSNVILNVSTEFLTSMQFYYSTRIYNESGYLVLRQFGAQTSNYSNYERGFNILGITDFNVNNNVISINLTINATKITSENVTVFMIFNASAIQSVKEINFTIGQNIVTIDFDNETLKRTHYNGMYTVDRIAIGRMIIDVNYTTASHNFESFAQTSYFKSYADAKIDTDSDGLIDHLQINYTLDIKTSDTYKILSQLFDKFDNLVASMYKSQTLTSGIMTVEMLINGPEIYKSKINGPYLIKFAILNDSSENIVDTVIESYVLQTQNLTFQIFERPPLPDFTINMTTTFNNETFVTTANVIVNNTGTADALNIIVDTFDNRNFTVTESIPSLVINQFAVFNYSIFNASNHITAIVDFDNLVDEINESDNIISIGNDPPTTPTNMTCGEVTTKLCTEPRTYSQFIRINVSGSIDPEEDNITYVAEAYYNHTTIVIGPNSTLNSFNNTIPSERLSFFDKKDIIRYITLPKTASVSTATFNIQGLSGGKWNYTGNAFSVAKIVNSLQGMSYDPDNFIWVADTGSPEELSKWSPNTGNLIDSCTMPFTVNIKGVYSNGTNLWVVDDLSNPDIGRIFMVNEPSGGSCSQVSSFNLNSNNIDPRGVASDGTYIYTADNNNALRKIFKYSIGGSFLQFYDISTTFSTPAPRDLEYDDMNSQFIICRASFCAWYTSSFSYIENTGFQFLENDGVTDNGTLIWRGRNPQSTIYEYYKFNSYPDNVFLDVGIDGDQEFNYTGEFSSSTTVSFGNKLNNLLQTCKPINGNCTIPVRFHTDTYGIINYSSINIIYRQEEETSNYFFDIIGSHNETSTFVWNLYDIINQTGVQLRARAIDLNGSNLYSSYFAPPMSITVNSSFVPNQPPYPQSVVIIPKYPHDEDTLDCSFNVTDADDLFVNVNVTWIKNMMPYTDDTENFTNVASGSIVHTTTLGDIEPEDTTLYDEWTCKIIAYDEEEAMVDFSSGKIIIPPLIANFSMLANSGLNAIFEFTMLNPGKLNDQYLWTLEPGDGSQVQGIQNMTLVPTENGIVYVEYTYSTSGQHNVTLTVTNYAITDDDMITVEVTQPGD